MEEEKDRREVVAMAGDGGRNAKRTHTRKLQRSATKKTPEDDDHPGAEVQGSRARETANVGKVEQDAAGHLPPFRRRSNSHGYASLAPMAVLKVVSIQADPGGEE